MIMPFLKAYHQDQREVAQAFQTGQPLRNNRTIRAEERATRASQRAAVAAQARRVVRGRRAGG
jgi:hypothetical protein